MSFRNKYIFLTTNIKAMRCLILSWAFKVHILLRRFAKKHNDCNSPFRNLLRNFIMFKVELAGSCYEKRLSTLWPIWPLSTSKNLLKFSQLQYILLIYLLDLRDTWQRMGSSDCVNKLLFAHRSQSLTWDQALFSFRFVNNIPAGKAKRKEF